MRFLICAAVLFSAAIVAHTINRGTKRMSAALDRLVTEVAQTRGVAASALAALTAIPQMIRDAIAADAAATDGKLNSLADDLDAAIAPLAGALAQNPGPTDPGGDTVTAPAGDAESVSAGDGDDSVDAGSGEDSVSGT